MTNLSGITKEEFAILAAPFAAREHEFRRGYIYIEETAICQRIEKVDVSWGLRVESVNRYDPRGALATVVCHLTIRGVTRSGVGMQAAEYLKDKPEVESGEIEKGAATDALKRAARLFGIGRYLLQCPKSVKDYGQELDRWLREVAREQGISAHSSSATQVNDHWSQDKEMMMKMYSWAFQAHKATKDDVNAIVASMGKPLTAYERDDVKAAVAKWASTRKAS